MSSFHIQSSQSKTINYLPLSDFFQNVIAWISKKGEKLPMSIIIEIKRRSRAVKRGKRHLLPWRKFFVELG